MHNSRASLFLMELMISIMFFALSGAVCVQLFVKAHTINELTQNKSQAVTIAQDICEYFHHFDGDKNATLSCFPYYEDSEENVLLYFSENGTNCPSSEAKYVATLNWEQVLSYHILTLEIKDTDRMEVLYSSQIKKYTQSTL